MCRQIFFFESALDTFFILCNWLWSEFRVNIFIQWRLSMKSVEIFSYKWCDVINLICICYNQYSNWVINHLIGVWLLLFFYKKKDKKCWMYLMWPVTSISSRIPSFSSSTSNGCTVYCDFNRHLECCKYLEMIIECFYRFHLHLDCALFTSYYIVVDICYQDNLLSSPKISNDRW